MKNWRTTVAGILAGTAQLWASGGFDESRIDSWIAALLLTAVGILAKDAGVTGPER